MRRASHNAARDAKGRPVVEIVAPAEGGTPRYRGLQLCENAWACPSCAPRITEGRRRELASASQRWRNQGGAVLLLTFTFSHGPLTELRGDHGAWDQLGRALQRYAKSTLCRKFREAVGWRGRVRAREITFGINGWHPHAHTLEYVNAELCTPELLAEWRPALAAEWQRCCKAVGLVASLAHGFDASLTDADDYIAKWGSAAELTKWHQKRGSLDPDAAGEARLNGLSPFDLLRIVAGLIAPDDRLKLTTDRAAALFTEYTQAVKGTAQLHWTRGLKKTLMPELEAGDGEGDDAEPVDEKPAEVKLGELDFETWGAVIRTDRQIELLGLVAEFGFETAERIARTWAAEWRAYDRAALRSQFRSRGVSYLYPGGP